MNAKTKVMLETGGYKTYKVHMLAFNEKNVIREVDIPAWENSGKSSDEVLEVIFTTGQNHNQPKNIESVSVGDVIELPTDKCPNESTSNPFSRQLWLVAGCGFERITETEFSGYQLTEQYHRRGHEVRKR